MEFFGLKLGLDQETRAAHPHQKIPRKNSPPPRENSEKAVETLPCSFCSPSTFRSLKLPLTIRQKHEESVCYFILKISRLKERKNTCFFRYQNANSLYSHYNNTRCGSVSLSSSRSAASAGNFLNWDFFLWIV